MNCGNPCGCKGALCSKCLSGILDNSNSCPSCNFEIACQPIKYRLAEDLIADEEVYCIYATDSTPACEWHGQLKDLQMHLHTNCLCFPAPCTNEGCSEVVPRHHLPTHLATECGYRLTQCQYCLVDLQVRSYEAHQGECSKFILPCVDCGGSFIREDTAAHDAMCPDKLVTCPFACHGCDVPVFRKDAERHQANHGANHAVLIAQRLSSVEEKLAASEAKQSELVDQCVSEAKAQLADDALKQSSTLLQRVNYLEAKLSSAVTAGPTKTYSWTIKDIKSLLSGRDRKVKSAPFTLEGTECKLLAINLKSNQEIGLEVSWTTPLKAGLVLTGSVYFNGDISSITLLKPDKISWYSHNESLFTTIDPLALVKYIDEETDTITIKFNLTLQYKEIEV